MTGGAMTGGAMTGGATGGGATGGDLAHRLCALARSLFDRGLSPGSSGNLSARTEDGGYLVTPTNVSLGRLDPARLSRLDAAWRRVGGDPPTKELPLHRAFFDTRPGTGAVVHLHSTHAVALSCLAGIDPDDALPPLTPYPVMRLGKVALLPYVAPGGPGTGEAVRALGGTRKAVLLGNHGPVVADRSLEAACDAIEELEEAARLALLLTGRAPVRLSDAQVDALRQTFPT